ncbi:MAG: hypothetical protein RIS08_190 [Actinomycetota bacterium]|jgi:hypothetical protein
MRRFGLSLAVQRDSFERESRVKQNLSDFVTKAQSAPIASGHLPKTSLSEHVLSW